ncbi:hypothetical protein BsWGS_06853 [Bradybaena similaris]
MNQMVQALYREPEFHIKKQNSENYRGSQPNVRADGDGLEAEPVSELYKKIQQGGDIPIRGLQKKAPEKNKSEYPRPSRD